MKNLKTSGLEVLEKIAKKAVDFSGSFSRVAVSADSNDCPDSDGCDGDCGCDEP